MLLPIVAAIVAGASGALLLLAASAMRRHLRARWIVQAGALGVPLVLALFVWLSM